MDDTSVAKGHDYIALFVDLKERKTVHICDGKGSQLNNGILGGVNSVLQGAKRKARGYKKAHFKTMAYLLTGKLDFSKLNRHCLPT